MSNVFAKVPFIVQKYKDDRVKHEDYDTMLERYNKTVILSFNCSSSRSGVSASTEFCFGFKVDTVP